jgi:hypothetical protein
MKKLAAAIVLAALFPLAGCATPYGYSPRAWANYDGDYDYGYDGYDRPITYYGQAEAGYNQVQYGQPYGNGYYAGQPGYGYAGPQAYGSQAYVAPPNASSWYATSYSGCGCGY